MLSRIMQLAEPALAANSANQASNDFFTNLQPYGATYLQTRHYLRPATTLTSQSHFAAGGVIARIAISPQWPQSDAFNYVCFEQNPLLKPIKEGRTRYLFSDFAPHKEKKYGNYWEAFSQAKIGDAICATSYGARNAIASIHLGFERNEFSCDEVFAFQMAGLILTEKLMGMGELPTPNAVFLTSRERDCMAFVAEGKTDWEISVILGISSETARFHIDNARRKLGATNRTQAVAKLVNMRII
ncbi:MAG: LuxR family transcriptional regulator [Hyphomonadaceae bacterium]|nr:MAG: LuxR family transcriptional regulator [Hyphomonadaceae bacterium]KAF0185066.1 MAG: LuxR family transcriptional regulator [Hyphomonadaceae bacterium]